MSTSGGYHEYIGVFNVNRKAFYKFAPPHAS